MTYYSDERRQRRGRSSRFWWTAGAWPSRQLESSEPARFFDVEYAIPADLVKGKEKVTVRFQATAGNEIATRVFGIRMIRADAER